MKRIVFLWISICLLNMSYQILLKQAVIDLPKLNFGLSWIKQILSSWWMIAAIISEILSFLVWMQILAKQDLSKAFPLSAISYILVLISSWILFKEEIGVVQLIGSLLILTGIGLIGTAASAASPNLDK